jgi:hypothetical protein
MKARCCGVCRTDLHVVESMVDSLQHGFQSARAEVIPPESALRSLAFVFSLNGNTILAPAGTVAVNRIPPKSGVCGGETMTVRTT